MSTHPMHRAATNGTAAPTATTPAAPAINASPQTRPQRARFSLHAGMVIIHRYVGLFIATFVFIAAFTGSFLAFYHELDGLTNPWQHVTPPAANAVPLDPFILRERIVAALPGAEAEVRFNPTPGESAAVWHETVPGSNVSREYFFDPYTGSLLGSREWGSLSEGLINLFPFMYRLHYELALGTVGAWLLGIVALLWTIDCFVGMYLTFPARRMAVSAADQRSWLARWKPSWLVKGNSLFGAIFTVHRASGLWVWPLLFVFAWSSVGFNLGPVFQPVMGAFGTHGNPYEDVPALAEPRPIPDTDWRSAAILGERLMTEEAARRNVTVSGADTLRYNANSGTWQYAVHSSLDLSQRWGGTSVTFDDRNGALVRFDAPTGLAAGDTLSSWLFALHMGTVGGLTYRIVVCVMGVVIAALCVTGVWIWWSKRALRVKAAIRAAAIEET